MKLLLLFLLTTNFSFAQHQDRQLLLYNIGLGAFTSGVGAIINTPKGGNWKHNLATALWQGSIGGALHYSGKKTLYLINEKQQLLYAWPARFQHAAGNSIIENAAMNKPFLQNWNMVIGPARFDYSLEEKGSFRVRLLPMTIFAIAEGCYSGDLDMNTSLLTGDLAFKGMYNILPGDALGSSYGRGFSFVDRKQDKCHIISHELVHEFQYNEYQVINSYFLAKAVRLKSGTLKQIFRKYIYFDLPYFFIPYALGRRSSYFHPYSNFYEFEAERFATNAFVDRHD